MKGETKTGIRSTHTRQGEGIHLCNDDTVIDAKVGKKMKIHPQRERKKVLLSICLNAWIKSKHAIEQMLKSCSTSVQILAACAVSRTQQRSEK